LFSHAIPSYPLEFRNESSVGWDETYIQMESLTKDWREGFGANNVFLSEGCVPCLFAL
jgi:hypothetical protein